ncbi:MAG: His/Gly/Thr/Pro-type tRNA ligase C-terminal domain-containing protein, partial [Psychrobacillus psychrotolerans]
LGEAAKKKAVELTYQLRQQKITAEMDYLERKMKTQMKSADRLGAKYVIVIGDDELEKESVMLKDLATGTQNLVPLSALIDQIKTSSTQLEAEE